MPTEILVYDEIVTPADQAFWGLGVSAESFARELPAEGDLLVRINSPGGDVDNGLAIYNLLLGARRAGRRVDVVVDGAAHSAASVIAMAGDKVCMAATASMLVHDPWAFAMGNADDMRAAADSLDTAKARLVPAYAQKTGLADETIRALMTAETELLPQKAKELNFADEVQEAPTRAQALKVWAPDQVHHPLARRALEQIQARAARQPRPAAQEPPMTNPTPAGPAPAPAPAAPAPQAQQPTEDQRRAGARAKLQAKRVPQAVQSWAEAQPLDALEAFAEQAQPFPLTPEARAADAPPSPAPLPVRAVKEATPAHAAVAARLGVDPGKLAAHLQQPWHAQAQAGDALQELLEQAENEQPEAEPVTPAQATAAAAMGVTQEQLAAHRKTPWHAGRRS